MQIHVGDTTHIVDFKVMRENLGRWVNNYAYVNFGVGRTPGCAYPSHLVTGTLALTCIYIIFRGRKFSDSFYLTRTIQFHWYPLKLLLSSAHEKSDEVIHHTVKVSWRYPFIHPVNH